MEFYSHSHRKLGVHAAETDLSKNGNAITREKVKEPSKLNNILILRTIFVQLSNTCKHFIQALERL